MREGKRREGDEREGQLERGDKRRGGGSMREREGGWGGRKEEDFSLTRVVWVKHHVRAESVKILRRPGNKTAGQILMRLCGWTRSRPRRGTCPVCLSDSQHVHVSLYSSLLVTLISSS